MFKKKVKKKGIFGTVISLANVYVLDGAKVEKTGLFQGYDKLVVAIVFMSALGGLLIAAVIAYADNIIKGFSVSISIVLSTLVAYFVLNDIVLNRYNFYILIFLSSTNFGRF
jgi:UDP-sugar transporter A1/2/3